MTPEKVNLVEKFSQIHEYWDPRIAGRLNGQLVKLVKFKGEFVWHKHDLEDEMFLVMSGNFNMELRNRTVPLSAGEFIIIPRGVEHRPVAPEEVQVMLFEPASTLNTGDAKDSALTKEVLKEI
jgi:mannose-6-phosphate isomerase-like protein (cupin superfamily)